ncbi:MAG: hypothetical protein NT040_14210 [Bacteroidetes bacterium]|nr:hypothetical protein [Bacteroidota bacterium]
MKDAASGIRNSLKKRQEAMERFQAGKREFLLKRELILREIEEAGAMWEESLKQIPNKPFG